MSEKNDSFLIFFWRISHFCRYLTYSHKITYVFQYSYEYDVEPEPETVPEQQTDVPTEAENNMDDDDANNDEDPHHHLPIGLALLTLLGKDELHHVPLYAEISCNVLSRNHCEIHHYISALLYTF
jgi:hypothetical protein